MARSRSSAPSRSAPKPAARSAPAPAARSAPPPAAPAHHAPAPSPSGGGGGMLSGLGSTMAQGFAFGTGSALAREAVGSMFGGSSSPAPSAPAPTNVPAAPVQTSGPCQYDQQAFQSCLQQNPTNASMCDHYFNALQACQSRQ
mmetsp:Transcript_69918/g.137278  ORF Transcript_69918/g.137278 Transcript_69918/m.137278 type:complete len:143 (-) Transcript_69918:276-704(-)